MRQKRQKAPGQYRAWRTSMPDIAEDLTYVAQLQRENEQLREDNERLKKRMARMAEVVIERVKPETRAS